MKKETVVEKGDIYFFYRYKVENKKGSSLKDLARFYLILNPDDNKKARLFIVGKKKMPKIQKGQSKSTAKEWMRNESTQDPKKLLKALRPIVYDTKTKGQRLEPGAVPAGSGRYVIFKKESSTELAYKLERPESAGKVQEELQILPQASYVISVKNPDIESKAFSDEDPDFPKTLKKKFAEKRWLPINDARFLNYENAQFLLIGAHDDLDEHDIKVTGRSKIYKALGLSKSEWPMDALENGEFAKAEHSTPKESPKGNRSKGGEHGGKEALKTSSAAGLTKALKGVELPRDKNELVSYAKDQKSNDEIIDVLKQMPDRKYKTMADVQKALGEVR